MSRSPASPCGGNPTERIESHLAGVTVMDRTLLLNATYEPLMVIDWRRAVSLVFLGKSDVLAEHSKVIRSPSQSMRVPSVLRLRERVRRAKPVVRFSRTNVYARDESRCQYCGEKFSASALTFDHVLPRSRGGQTTWQNIVTACMPCNRIKGDKTPEEAGMPLLKEPVRPKLLPYVKQITGKTPESWKFYLW